jgi:hypothetical protein
VELILAWWQWFVRVKVYLEKCSRLYYVAVSATPVRNTVNFNRMVDTEGSSFGRRGLAVRIGTPVPTRIVDEDVLAVDRDPVAACIGTESFTRLVGCGHVDDGGFLCFVFIEPSLREPINKVRPPRTLAASRISGAGALKCAAKGRIYVVAAN